MQQRQTNNNAKKKEIASPQKKMAFRRAAALALGSGGALALGSGGALDSGGALAACAEAATPPPAANDEQLNASFLGARRAFLLGHINDESANRLVQQLLYLRHAVATILGFVGVKMVLEFFHIGVSSGVSLGIICGLLAAGTIASVMHNKKASAAHGRVAVQDTPLRDVV